MAPLVAIAGDATEDLLTLAALTFDGIGAGPLAAATLFVTAIAASAKGGIARLRAARCRAVVVALPVCRSSAVRRWA